MTPRTDFIVFRQRKYKHSDKLQDDWSLVLSTKPALGKSTRFVVPLLKSHSHFIPEMVSTRRLITALRKLADKLEKDLK